MQIPYKKKRVLHVLNTLELGGAEIYAWKLIKNLDAKRFENHLAFTSGDVLRERFEKLPLKLFQMGKMPFSFKRPYRNILTLYRLFRYIKDNQIDVIHAHLFEPYFWGFFVAQLTNVPLIRTVVSNRRDAPRWQYFFERIWTRFTKYLVVFSENSRQEMIDYIGTDPNRIHVIPNGVECNQLDVVGEDRRGVLRQALDLKNVLVVGTVGRLHPHKNQALFLRAAARVGKEFEDVVFVIDGEGPLRAELESLADALGIASRVIFTGFSSDVYALISLFDVFVLSSVTEGAPTVVIEAMGLGVPVVATAVGGVPSLITSGQTGFLVDVDEGAMAKAIVDLLKNPQWRQDMAMAGRAICKKKYDFVEIAKRVGYIYESC